MVPDKPQKVKVAEVCFLNLPDGSLFWWKGILYRKDLTTRAGEKNCFECLGLKFERVSLTEFVQIELPDDISVV